jgi:hypothetical protein
LKEVQERPGNALEAIGIGNGFLSRTQQLREMINKRDYMKLKSFFTANEMISKLKRLPIGWEKILASYASDRGLITRIYRKLKYVNSLTLNEKMKKWANELYWDFSKWLENT